MPCENRINDQDKCRSVSWLFVDSGNSVVQLTEHGQIGVNAKSNSDRLSVTDNCSLVIMKVTIDDDGYYTCRQIKSGQYQDANVHLFVLKSEYLLHNQFSR